MNSLNTKQTVGRLLLFEAAGKDFEMKQSVVRGLEDGEILVKNLYTTICGSDLHTYCGLRKEASPTVLGHEIVGEILEIESNHSGFDLNGIALKKGDRVSWSVFASDPETYHSLNEMPQKSNGLFKYGHAIAIDDDVFHGGLSDFCILRKHTAILKLPENLPLNVAATLNCSISTVAGALRLAGDLAHKNVLITGMGHLGLTCAAMCREAGANWIGAADIEDERLEDLLKFGASEVFNLKTGTDSLEVLLQNSFKRRGVDIVFDMSGSPDAMELGIRALAIGGTAIWVGAVFNTRRLQIDPEAIIRNLLTIRGLHNYNYSDFKTALDFIVQHWKKYPFELLVSKEFSLDKAKDAFEYAAFHKPIRVGIRI